MDVVNNSVKETNTECSELIQYLSPHPASDPAASLRINKKSAASKIDVLDAIRLDPAVLEAQITIDTSGNRPATTKPCASASKAGKAAVVKQDPPSKFSIFEKMMSVHQAALSALSPPQFESLLKYTDTLRTQRRNYQRDLECAFCKNNRKPVAWYTSHVLKNWRGKIQCPVLRAHICPRCGATGDYAHTIKYCPKHYSSERIAGILATSNFERVLPHFSKPRY